MFIRDFIYTIKILVRGKVVIFWTLIFPILLATFMYMAFGNLYESDEMFSHIKVAVVTEDAKANGLSYMLESLAQGEDALIAPQYLKGVEAEKALGDKEVEGIIYTDDVRLEISKNSINASILETVLSEYKQYEYALKDVLSDSELMKQYMASENGANDMVDLANKLASTTSYYTEKSSTQGSQNVYNNYFYAIFAMSCFFGSFATLTMMNNLQANISATGKRKNVSPQKKMTFVLAEFSALLLIQFLVEVIAFGYMNLLGVDFGSRIWEILLTLFMGCLIGLSMGVIIGAGSRLSQGAKIGLSIGISMVMSILADLCINGIKHEIQLHAPIINKLNPAALISDTFYALNVYSDHRVFTENICIMAAESVVLVTIGILLARRNRYASV